MIGIKEKGPITYTRPRPQSDCIVWNKSAKKLSTHLGGRGMGHYSRNNELLYNPQIAFPEPFLTVNLFRMIIYIAENTTTHVYFMSIL
jgi:hypothetical protein